jgi:fructokinase
MRIGIDLGGTKIAAIAMAANGQVIAEQRIATPGGYDDCLQALRQVTNALEAQAGRRGARIGVGMPGSLSPASARVRNANSQWLNGRDFLTDAGHALGRPVRVANDADCFTLSEAVDGAGKGAASVFGVILGTGCGGGLAIDARLRIGAARVAGEWGHTPLPWANADEWPGPACWCGKAGCMETWVSGPAFERWAGAMIGKPLRAAEIAAAAQAGDARAKAAIDLLADRLARGLSVVINIFDPHVIVFGGGLSNIDALYPAVQTKLADYVFSDVVAARVVANVHGDSSGVRGAAWLWPPGESFA